MTVFCVTQFLPGHISFKKIFKTAVDYVQTTMFLVNANASSVICSFTIAFKITSTQLEFEWFFLKFLTL